jgi:hypothetical protein
MEEIQLGFSEIYSDAAENFFNVYNINSSYTVCDVKPQLKKKQERVCRFCGKSYGEVKFKDNAHVFPRSLGNESLVSDFECEVCNKKFSRYENDLCYFLGIERTINRTHGYKSIPTFKNKNIRAQKSQCLGHDAIKISSLAGSLYEMNKEPGIKIISNTKHAYTPINVYKAF